MTYTIPLTAEEISAREAMPKTASGHIVALQFLNDKTALAMEPAWREWMRAHPKRLWPEHIQKWPHDRKARGIK